MRLTRYHYTGPQSGVCLKVGADNPLLDVQLTSGQPVELPADHEYTRVLLALKHLTELPIAHITPTAALAVVADKKGTKTHGR
jgi:hypothetical protein